MKDKEKILGQIDTMLDEYNILSERIETNTYQSIKHEESIRERFRVIKANIDAIEHILKEFP